MDNKLNFVKFTKTICELIKVFSQLILFSTSKQHQSDVQHVNISKSIHKTIIYKLKMQRYKWSVKCYLMTNKNKNKKINKKTHLKKAMF